MKTELVNQKSILIFIDWYTPAFLAGGPIQSINSLVKELHDDFKIFIITSNVDLDQKALEDITPNTWIKNELGHSIYYAETKSMTFKKIKSLLFNLNFDVVYINSFFSFNYSLLPLMVLKLFFANKKIILAPRGMLGKGALEIKPIKKKIFIYFARLVNLHYGVTWHATSLQEKNEIKKNIIPQPKISLISNVPKILIGKREFYKKQYLNLCYVSRISFKKNLLFALQILNKIKNIEINFNIYGPIEDVNYWNSCLEIIKSCPKNININYIGTVKPHEIERVFLENDVLFLPTLNENFGHSIVESLLCGCPAIISDQTPWNDLESHNAGFALPLDNPQAFVEAIHHYANLNQESYTKASVAAQKYMASKINIEQTVEQYKNLFNDCIKN